MTQNNINEMKTFCDVTTNFEQKTNYTQVDDQEI